MAMANTEPAFNPPLIGFKRPVEYAVVTHVEGIGIFYCQPDDGDSLEEFVKLTKKVKHLERSKLSKPPMLNKIYGGLFAEDKEYYRCLVVEKVTENKFEVVFIDFGNSSVMDKEDMFELPEQLENLSSKLHKCLIDEVPRDSEKDVLYPFDRKMINKLRDQLTNEYVSVVNREGKISVFHNEVNIGELYKREKLAFNTRKFETSVKPLCFTPEKKSSEYPVYRLIRDLRCDLWEEREEANTLREDAVEVLSTAKRVQRLSEDICALNKNLNPEVSVCLESILQCIKTIKEVETFPGLDGFEQDRSSLAQTLKSKLLSNLQLYRAKELPKKMRELQMYEGAFEAFDHSALNGITSLQLLELEISPESLLQVINEFEMYLQIFDVEASDRGVKSTKAMLALAKQYQFDDILATVTLDKIPEFIKIRGNVPTNGCGLKFTTTEVLKELVASEIEGLKFKDGVELKGLLMAVMKELFPKLNSILKTFMQAYGKMEKMWKDIN